MYIHANPSAIGGIFPLIWSNSAIPTGIQIIPLLAPFASGRNPMPYNCIVECAHDAHWRMRKLTVDIINRSEL